ncbi:MAG TPA: peptidylprolyl isomerase, partial [Nevskiaceae bacterium]|nr:peptidylprolyl isomerase [Nevskiaceae bacterium]
MHARTLAIATAAFLAGVALTLGLAPAFAPTPSATPFDDLTRIAITPAERQALDQAKATDRWLDDEILFREGLRRGFAFDDLIVRRELHRRTRMALLEAAPPAPTDDAALGAFLAAHADRYQAPVRRSFDHVFLGKGAHGRRLDADAAAVGERLRARPDAFAALGDAFPGGSTRVSVTDVEVEADFGGAFTRALANVPAGTWTGPIASPLGAHWVRVTQVEPARALGLAE